MKCIELNKGHVAIVDDEDFERLAQWRWWVDCKGYVIRHAHAGKVDGIYKRKVVRMHHEVLSPSPGMLVDHRNLNKLDNRRLNLRIATHAQSSMNRGRRSDNKTGIKGVYFDKRSGKYMSAIKANGVKYRLGYFKTPEEAGAAYAEAAKLHHGDFHRLN